MASSAEDGFNVMPQPTATPTAPVNLGATQSYIIGFGIAAIVVIIVVGAVLAMLMVRKRP